MESKSKSRHIPRKIKLKVLDNQNYKCANKPDKPALNLHDYKCYLWIYNYGNFDEATYDFDHIEEHCIKSDNSINNIQALCPNYHRVKTNRFNNQKQHFSTLQLAKGQQYMDIDNNIIKKRKII